MGPSCSSPRTASSMVSARRAIRPIVAIYPRSANRNRSTFPRTLFGVSKRRADGPPVKRRPNKPKKSKGQRVRGLLKVLTILGLVGVLIAVGLFFVLYKAIEIPEPNEAFEAQTTFVYYSGGKDELGTYYDDQNRQSIPLSEMPQTMQDAVVAAENRTFWTDKGLDPKGIIRAAFSNARGNA